MFLRQFREPQNAKWARYLFMLEPFILHTWDGMVFGKYPSGNTGGSTGSSDASCTQCSVVDRAEPAATKEIQDTSVTQYK